MGRRRRAALRGRATGAPAALLNGVDPLSLKLRIQLFDSLRIEHGNASVAHFRTQKTASLLAYLAFCRGRVHQRETLIEMLWPDDPPEAARGSLSTAVWSLRSQLAELGLDAGEIIRADRSTLGLAP